MSSNEAAIPRKKIRSKPAFSVRQLVTIAMLSAIAVILQMIKTHVPFGMPWLELEISDVPALLAAFGMGPVAGIFVELIKNLFKCLFGTNTAYVGEFANFLVGVCLVVPAGLIYRKMHTRKGAMLGLIVGGVLFCVMGALLNIYLLLPMFSFGDPEKLITSAQSIIPSIQSFVGIAVIGTTPFNVLRAVLMGITTMLLYKPLSPLLHK